MKKRNYAPIVVFVYNRPDKARRTIESLSNNELSKECDVYIFSDGPKNERATEGVNEVRDYLDSLDNNNPFNSLVIEKSPVNKGLAMSIIGGVSRIITEYGRAIIVEDDLILSKYFLNYMNECLDYYENDDRIWSISGYSPRLKSLDNYDKNVYLDYRASSWGWGTWKDRWDKVDWTVPDYNRFRFNPFFYIRFCRGGNDLPSMMKAQMKGKIDSWAVRWCYYQSRYDKLSISPKNSLVSNDGFDGSGINCNEDGSKKFSKVNLETSKTEWKNNDLIINRRIIKELYDLNHLSITIRIRDLLRRILKK